MARWCSRRGAAFVALRVAPLRLAVLILVAGTAACLLSGCGSQRDSAFTDPPAPDLAVTTLLPVDIELVATVIQLQETLRLGHLAAEGQRLPPSLQDLAQLVDEQRHSRARDLDQLIVVKHAPVPAGLGPYHRALLEDLTSRPAPEWPAGFMDFQGEVQRELMRVLRAAADRSEDPDVRAFAQRQLPAVVSMLQRIEHYSHA